MSAQDETEFRNSPYIPDHVHDLLSRIDPARPPGMSPSEKSSFAVGRAIWSGWCVVL